MERYMKKLAIIMKMYSVDKHVFLRALSLRSELSVKVLFLAAVRF